MLCLGKIEKERDVSMKILQAFASVFHEKNPRTNFTCAGIFIPKFSIDKKNNMQNKLVWMFTIKRKYDKI